MNEVALQQANGLAPATGRATSPMQSLAYSMTDIWEMALQVAESRLFPGIDTPPKAFTLMLLCQSEGIHPMQALRRFDIIEGKPAMKSPAIQAEFQARGGKVKIVRSDAEEARAVFSHPVLQPDGFEMAVTYKEFEKSGLTQGKDGIKKNWRMSAADMLWWRLMSKGIKKIDPGIVTGIGSSEELMDAIETNVSLAIAPQLEAPIDRGYTPPAYVDPEVVGHAGTGFDDRPYHQVVTDAVKATLKAIADAVKQADCPPELTPEISPHDVHRHILHAAINLGYAEGPPPTNLKKAIEALTKVYKAERGWVRKELTYRLTEIEEAGREAIQAALDARQTGSEEKAADPDDDLEPGVNC